MRGQDHLGVRFVERSALQEQSWVSLDGRESSRIAWCVVGLCNGRRVLVRVGASMQVRRLVSSLRPDMVVAMLLGV